MFGDGQDLPDGIGATLEDDASVRRYLAHMQQIASVEVLNDVVLNQVLVRFADDDAVTAAVIDRVQRDGTCYPSASTFRGRAAMRISIVGWQTTAHDIDRSAEAILAATRP
jgi:hypothetical protein